MSRALVRKRVGTVLSQQQQQQQQQQTLDISYLVVVVCWWVLHELEFPSPVAIVRSNGRSTQRTTHFSFKNTCWESAWRAPEAVIKTRLRSIRTRHAEESRKGCLQRSMRTLHTCLLSVMMCDSIATRSLSKSARKAGTRFWEDSYSCTINRSVYRYVNPSTAMLLCSN